MESIAEIWEPGEQAARSSLSLAPDEVHVWRASLRRPVEEIEARYDVLSVEEQARAARFHFAKDREAFIIGRGLLRGLLAQYLDISPPEVRFRYTPHGKPTLEAGAAGGEIEFNLSHAHDRALYGFTRGRRIGVDIEWIRPDFGLREVREIAIQFFSPREVAVLNSLPEALRQVAFFHCWTRKESYIKARGEGLSMPLDRFDVTLHPDSPATLLQTLDDPQEALRWHLRALAPHPGYVAAVAVEAGAPDRDSLQWRFRDF